jgi:outer membrane protein TolC
MTFMRPLTLSCLLLLASPASQPAAQEAREPPRGLLRLGALQHEAVEADPRMRQIALEAARTALRLDGLAAERRPSLALEGQVQYQSDVPTVPFTLPGGDGPLRPPKDSYDASVRVDQPLLDPTVRPRRALEEAELAERQARVHTTLFALRQEVTSAYFSAAALQEQAAALEAAIANLEARLRETSVRVQEGAALPADAAAIEATLLQRRQDELEVRGNREAALARLGELTHRRITHDDVLVIPDLLTPVTSVRATLADVRMRPEYEQFARTRERLDRQQDVASAQEAPRVSAFARAGYARPGLTVFGDEFDAYSLAGVRVSWRAWTWGRTGREREELRIQQEIIAADEAAFTDTLRRAIQDDLAAFDRLQAALELDEQIIRLREDVERAARAQLDEGVLTASDYVSRHTELLDAQVDRARRRVELAGAAARLLTTLGVEVQ